MAADWSQPSEIALACARGLVPYALQEVKDLGYEIVAHDDDSIVLRGSMLDAMRLNLWLRTAHRVLFPVGECQAKNLEHLYNHAVEMPWEDWLDPDGYFTVHGAVKNDTVRDTRMPALHLKDAIADRMRKACGRRPNSGKELDGAAVFFLWRQRDLKIFIDTSGIPLSRRGYRLIPGKAPMQEALAAACVIASGWDPATPFVAPMCGSGTPAIEAAMIAKKRAPGLTRPHFAFKALKGFNEPIPGAEGETAATPAQIWEELRTAARAGEIPSTAMPRIIATDISAEAVRIARANAKAANVLQLITFGVCDFADTALPSGPGAIFMNPEYGERMGDTTELVPLYRRIGAWYADHPDYIGCVFTASRRLAEATGLTPNFLKPFFNGALDCRLLSFNGKR